MAKNKKETNQIDKKDWVSNFNLVGTAKVSDYTYKIDEQSEKSDWIYNSFNLGVDCGEKFGTVYCEMMGGYADERENVIYAHGKDDDGKDDFDNKLTIDWDDRFDEEIIESCGSLCFITVGLETTAKTNKTFYKKFLSAYDAIAYIQEHLEDGMVVNVKGNLKYSTYNDTTQVRKNITSIVLSKAEPEKFRATFTQSVLLDKASANLKNIDKDRGIMYVDARVLDYVKEINGVEIKGQYPYPKQFEYAFPDLTNQEQVKKIMDKLFKVKKDVTQVTFEGQFIEGGAVVQATLDDIPQDIKDLIDMGIYTEEEALARCSSSGNREQHMILTKPFIKLVGDDKTPVMQIFANRYTEDDLYFDIPDVEDNAEENDNAKEDIDNEDDTETDSSSSMDWLNNL